MKNIVAIAALLVLLVAPACGASVRQENVRVALVKGVESIRIDGDGVLATDEGGTPLRLALPLPAKRVREGVSIGGKTVRRLVLASPGAVQVNGKRYRGTIEVLPQDKGLLVVDELPIEEYLVGLINCEISSLWPMEAIKAQAVVARTYAVYQKRVRAGALYHLESSVLDQVYDGCDIEDSRAARGVKETAGEVLTYGGQPIQAFYHSNCGGRTEVAENVWGFRLPYLRSVECAYCAANPSARWEQTLSLKKLESLLKGGGCRCRGFGISVRGSGTRAGGLPT